MKAVILAAGVGSRLKKLTEHKPKCMLPILNNHLLIDCQIAFLKKIGILEEDIFIIGGYKIEILRKYLSKYKVNIMFNPKFKEWNNIYSFYLIDKFLKEDDNFILLNSDTLFHFEILKNLINTPQKNVVVIDPYKPLGEEEMKVLVKNNRIIEFGKSINISNAFGEYIGVGKFEKKSIKPVFKIIHRLIEQGQTHLWYELAFNYVLDSVVINYIDTKLKPWIEIDTLEDYKKALQLRSEICFTEL